MSGVWIVVGLGNPGARYEKTRHNIGFEVLDALVEQQHGSWRTRFNSFWSETKIADQVVYLLKPQTYMNESGRAVQEACHFWKVGPENILVVHDELDIPFGALRLKRAGGIAGHNGLRSIVEHLSSADFYRMRMGIGRPEMPGFEISKWVLSKFSEQENQDMKLVLEQASHCVEEFLSHGLSRAQERFHGGLITEKAKKA